MISGNKRSAAAAFLVLAGLAGLLAAQDTGQRAPPPDGIAYIQTIAEENATGSVKAGYEAVRSKTGALPNLHRLYSLSPVAYGHLRAFGAAMADAKAWALSARERQLIGIVVANANECFY